MTALSDFFIAQGDQSFRGKQVYEWLWKKGAHRFEDMTNLSKDTRTLLEEHFVINHIHVDAMQKSKDGTIKNAIKLHDGLIVESVLIPTSKRTTTTNLYKASGIVWDLTTQSVYDEDKGAEYFRMTHELTANIKSTDSVSFEIAFTV